MRMSRRLTRYNKSAPSGPVYYYELNNQHAEKTGGYYLPITSYNPSLTTTTDGRLNLYAGTNYANTRRYYACTVLSVDLTHINSLVFTAAKTSNNGGYCGIIDNPSSLSMSNTPPASQRVTLTTTAKESTLDVSGFSGFWYIFIQINYSSAYGRAHVYVTEIRGE